jgi:hypothetical protein
MKIFSIILKVIGGLALFALAILLFGFGTMYLWNWIMPYLFHLPVIDFYMAIGMVLLSKILFGSIRVKNGGWGQRRFWKAKWESMSDDDREKFKQDFAERCRKKWGKGDL